MTFPLRNPMRSGFSLTELLVVIALIGALAILSFAVGSGVSQRAGAARCIANLRQVSPLFSAYAADHRGLIGLHSYESGAAGSSKPWSTFLVEKGYLSRTSDLQLCAEAAPRRYTATGRIYGVVSPTSAQLAAVPFDTSGSFTPSSGTRFVRLLSMSDAANYWLLADSWSATWNEQIYIISNDHGGLHYRHLGRANFLFADGHVEALTPEETRNRAFRYYPVSKGFYKNGQQFNF